MGGGFEISTIGSHVRAATLVVATTAAVTFAGGAVTGSVAAADPAGAVTSSAEIREPAQLQDVTFTALFGLGIQVYEEVTVRPIDSDISPGGERVLRRLPSAADGDPSRRHYAFLGAPLPEAFSTSFGTVDTGDLRGGLIIALDPVTYQRIDPQRFMALYVPVGPLGAVAGAAIAGPYYG